MSALSLSVFLSTELKGVILGLWGQMVWNNMVWKARDLGSGSVTMSLVLKSSFG